MKKTFGIIIAIAALFVATPSDAQIKFGLKAGLNVTKPSFDKDVVAADNRTGFIVGPMAEFTLPIVGLGVDAAVLYDNKSVKVSNGTESSSETLHYIDIPINVKYSLGLGSLAGVYVATGPQFSFNVGEKNILKQSYALNKSDFSWNVGAGVKLLKHIQVGYNYNIALGNTADVKKDSPLNTLVKGGDFKNNTHQVTVAYLF